MVVANHVAKEENIDPSLIELFESMWEKIWIIIF
jgi:hypothetical protein